MAFRDRPIIACAIKSHLGTMEITLRALNQAAAMILPEEGRVPYDHAAQTDSAVAARAMLPARLPADAIIVPDNFNIETDGDVLESWLTGEIVQRDGHFLFLLPYNSHRVAVKAFDAGHVTATIYHIVQSATVVDIAAFTSFHADDAQEYEFEASIMPRGADLETLERLFWSDVNPSVDDPFYTPEAPEPEGRNHTFVSGSHEALVDISLALVQTWIGANSIEVDDNFQYFRFDSDTEDESGGPSTSDASALDKAPEILIEALQKVFEQNRFAGISREYNDGPHYRDSGYSTYPDTILIDIEAIDSAHDAIEIFHRQRGKAIHWLLVNGFTKADAETITGPIADQDWK